MLFRFRIFITFLTLLFAIECTPSARADSLSTDFSRFDDLYAQSTRAAQQRSLSIHLNIAGLGKATLELDRIKLKNWPSYFVQDGKETIDDTRQVLLAGKLTRRGARSQTAIPVAVSYIGQGRGGRLIVHFVAASRVTGRRRYYRIEARRENAASRVKRLRVSSVPESMLHNRTCSSPGEFPYQDSSSHGTESSHADLPRRSALVQWDLEIATEADFEYYQVFGAAANAEIATLINATEVIYERDLGITFSIRGQRVQTSSAQPFTSTAAQTLLQQTISYVASNPPNPRGDVTHLFSGKNFDGSTVGIAYLRVVCSNSNASVGANQRINSALDYVVFAHELGHNFGADHDTSLPASIMYPSVSTSQQSFSLFSINQIDDHVSSYGAICLGPVSSNPTPTPTRTPTPTATITVAVTTSPGTPSPTPIVTPQPSATVPVSPTPPGTETPTFMVPNGSAPLLVSVQNIQRTKRGFKVAALIHDQALTPVSGQGITLLRFTRATKKAAAGWQPISQKRSNAFGASTFRTKKRGRFRFTIGSGSDLSYSDIFSLK